MRCSFVECATSNLAPLAPLAAAPFSAGRPLLALTPAATLAATFCAVYCIAPPKISSWWRTS